MDASKALEVFPCAFRLFGLRTEGEETTHARTAKRVEAREALRIHSLRACAVDWLDRFLVLR